MLPTDRVTTGLAVGTGPPLRRVELLLRAARVLRFDVAWTVDHFLGFVPQSLWDGEFSWAAREGSSPHRYYDYQVLLGHLARRAGNVRLAVGVTEPTRRHPVLLAQAFLTLSHMTSHAPILGIGAGERENIEPYGLDFSTPVGRLEEALAVIRRCFTSRGPIDFEGRHFRLRGAVMDLAAPDGRVPEIWVAAHAPRMLRVTGKYGDGWYPTDPMSPEEFAARWAMVRDAARENGRDPDRIVAGWQAFVLFAPNEAAARRVLDSRSVRFAALLAGAEMWGTYGIDHPFGPEFRGFIDFVPGRRSRAELDAAIAAVPTDLLVEHVLWGDADAVHARLRDYVDAGLRHLVLQPVSALVSRRDAAYSLAAAVRVARRLKR
jgi:phthiodiolone/phenolphthiodiolone dimycocerosates ketoreductase